MKLAKNIRGPKDRDRPPIWFPEDVSDEMNNIIETINSAKLVLELHEQATHAPYGIADRRLKVLELALRT